MNNNTLEKAQVQEKMDSSLVIKDFSDRCNFESTKIHIDYINAIRDFMEKENINKSHLADKLDTSKSYITQLFSADKFLNLKILGKLQALYNIRFHVSLMHNDMNVSDEVIDAHNREHFKCVITIAKPNNHSNVEDIETNFFYKDKIRDSDYPNPNIFNNIGIDKKYYKESPNAN